MNTDAMIDDSNTHLSPHLFWGRPVSTGFSWKLFLLHGVALRVCMPSVEPLLIQRENNARN